MRPSSSSREFPLQIPITAAKTHPRKLVDAVTLKYERATITKHGEPVAVLISEAADTSPRLSPHLATMHSSA
ncbi:type II toxin-antitoxin system Phd/YefM family antitoxin [Cryobacterium sp. 10I5]|uniref:type II toxin-antitoxin system Phd/YefM family antitoxin n=1 Tax=Cryobacterium sp. 10I5 TaxID=3048581 RepID=UPI003A598864